MIGDVGNVVVYTALYGPHDELKTQPSLPGVDYLCFTDQPVTARGWEVVQVRPALPDRLASKEPKMEPHRWVRRWRQSIWVDASVQIVSSDFASIVLGAMDDGLALFAHPDRDCIYEEAEVSKTMPKYDVAEIDAQMARYRAEGYPEHAGLWASGIIAREHRRSMRRLGRKWFDRCKSESVQCQISLPPLLRSLGITPGTIPGNLWDNDLIQVLGHLRET